MRGPFSLATFHRPRCQGEGGVAIDGTLELTLASGLISFKLAFSAPDFFAFHVPAKVATAKSASTPMPDGVEKKLSAAALKMRLLKRLKCTQKFEKRAWESGAKLVAGVDEVGRGCLFGPVVAAAVILDPSYRIRKLRDSKLIPAELREELALRIREHSVAIAIASVDVETIDAINIYHASRLAMLQAVTQLATSPDHLLVDAMVVDFPSAESRLAQTRIIHGDALSVSIAAASIIAKVERDRMMREISDQYPQYDLASNKGYSAPKHLAALREHGPTPLHRRTFAPVWMAERSQEALLFMSDDSLELENMVAAQAPSVGPAAQN